MIDPNIQITELPLPDTYFDQDEPSRFDVNTVLTLGDLMFWSENYDDVERFYESIVLAAGSDFTLETGEMKVIGADPDKNSVVVNITGRVF